MKFFREFACWKIKEKRRKTVEDMQEVQMADVTSGDLLARMQKLTRGVFEVVDELPEGAGRDRVKVELQIPLTPIVTKTPKSSKKAGEKSGAMAGVRLDFTETVRREKITLLAESKQEEEPASGRPYLYLSDAHVEAMIL